MDSELLELKAFRVHQHAAAIRDAINFTLQSADTSEFVYAIRSRVKPVSKIVAKVDRKRRIEKRDPYEPETVTDIVGFRFVVLFREDIIQVATLLLKMIGREAPFTTAPFVSRGLLEAISYTSQSTGDPEAINYRLEELFTQFGYPFKVVQVETKYSSIHLVAAAHIPHEGNLVSLPVEIQIRTVFEDAWSEIDHKLRYSLDRERELGRLDAETVNERLASWKPHLNALKVFVDGSALYAGLIKAQSRAQRQINYYAGALVPVESFDEAKEAIGQMSPEMEAALKAAYEQMEEADKLHKATGEKHLFSAAATKFKELLAKLPRHDSESMPPIEYFAKMEQAYCYLSAGTSFDIETAIQIYLELEPRLRDVDVRLAFRLGSAFAIQEKFVLASEQLDKAIAALNRKTDVPADHPLRTDVPKRAGIVAWHRSQECVDTPTRLQFLVRAIEYTRSIQREALFVANNILYYLVEYFNWGGVETEALQKAEVKKLTEFMEKELQTPSADEKLEPLHTICRALVYLADFVRAKPYAKRLSDLIEQRHKPASEPLTHFEEFTASLTPQVREMWEFALATLKMAEEKGIK